VFRASRTGRDGGHGLGTWTVSGTVVRSAGFLCLSYRRGLLIGHSDEIRVSLLVGAGFLALDIQGLIPSRSSEFQPRTVKGDYEAVLLAVHPLCPVGLDGGGDERPREFAGIRTGPPRQPGQACGWADVQLGAVAPVPPQNVDAGHDRRQNGRVPGECPVSQVGGLRFG
jgi:hypothetical protein